MPFSAAEKRRRREAERNAALRGNPDALEKRAREAARKKRQREAAEAERARKRRRKGELRVANSISSAIAAAALGDPEGAVGLEVLVLIAHAEDTDWCHGGSGLTDARQDQRHLDDISDHSHPEKG